MLGEITAKDWFLFALGSGLTLLIAILRYIREYFREYAQITPLLGEWHTFHWTHTNHEPCFSHTKWIFRRSFFGLKMDSVDKQKKTLPYKGRVSFQSGQVIITSEGTSHKETWHARLNDPIPNENTMMIGLQLAQDFDRDMYATLTLCCKIQKSDEEAKAILVKYARLVEQEHCVRLRKHFED